jgi:hypothetical protein
MLRLGVKASGILCQLRNKLVALQVHIFHGKQAVVPPVLSLAGA